MNSIFALQGLLRDVSDLGCTVTLGNVDGCPHGLKVTAAWDEAGVTRSVWTSFYEINNEYEFIRGLVNLAEAVKNGYGTKRDSVLPSE